MGKTNENTEPLFSENPPKCGKKICTFAPLYPAIQIH
jgi:hypothetical protein